MHRILKSCKVLRKEDHFGVYYSNLQYLVDKRKWNTTKKRLITNKELISKGWLLDKRERSQNKFGCEISYTGDRGLE